MKAGPNYLRNQRDRERRERNAEVFEQGRQAALAGKHCQSNPHKGTTLALHWAEGHEQGERERDQE